MSTREDASRHDSDNMSETQSNPPVSDPRTLAAQTRQRLDDARPDQVGPYKILEPLGEGGMGVVYLAEQTSPGHRRAALKIIKAGGLDAQGQVGGGRFWGVNWL